MEVVNINPIITGISKIYASIVILILLNFLFNKTNISMPDTTPIKRKDVTKFMFSGDVPK